jgi:hypothetical protein
VHKQAFLGTPTEASKRSVKENENRAKTKNGPAPCEAKGAKKSEKQTTRKSSRAKSKVKTKVTLAKLQKHSGTNSPSPCCEKTKEAPCNDCCHLGIFFACFLRFFQNKKSPSPCCKKTKQASCDECCHSACCCARFCVGVQGLRFRDQGSPW